MKLLVVLLSLAHLALGSKQFLIPDAKANWHEAHEFCTTQGMQLVSIDSQADHDVLVAYIMQSDKFDIHSEFWIGASDLAKEGRYTWIGSGLPLNFTKWATGEPNKYYADENCIVMNYYGRQWVWNDLRCREEAYIVCVSVPNECNCIELSAVLV